MVQAELQQTERAYQKQEGVFQNSKNALLKKTKTGRWVKSIGLGYKIPVEALEGNYVDKKCPFTGDVSIRGRILTGTVASNKMKNTITVRREYLHYVQKYNRYEKRHKKISAHLSPAFRVDEGDLVTIGQCRPLSKTVRFNVIKVDKQVSSATKKFQKF